MWVRGQLFYYPYTLVMWFTQCRKIFQNSIKNILISGTNHQVRIRFCKTSSCKQLLEKNTHTHTHTHTQRDTLDNLDESRRANRVYIYLAFISKFTLKKYQWIEDGSCFKQDVGFKKKKKTISVFEKQKSKNRVILPNPE